MSISSAHQELAEKFVFKKAWPEALVGDSLLGLVRFAFTEEEAQIVNALGFTPRTAKSIAKKVQRPEAEVGPILASLADRLLILSLDIRGKTVYSFFVLVPGIFETQMIRSQTTGEDPSYYQKFARLYNEVYDEYMTWLQPVVEKKELRFERIVPVERSIQDATGVMPLATDMYSEIVNRNKKFCLIEVCACRQEYHLLGKGCDKPRDVCSAMGVAADLAVKKGLGHWVSKEEFIEAKQRASAAGLVHMVDNIHDPLQVCSCCTCCCSALRMLKHYNIPTIIAKSHFEASVDSEKCQGCGKCAKICPMDAIAVVGKNATIDHTRCIGCGLCVSKCDQSGAMSLKERKNHQPPAGTLGEYMHDRYHEIYEDQARLLPRLTLGLGKLIGRVSPVQVSGPRHKSFIKD